MASGITLKQYLQDKCINASELARKMGISRQVIAGWLRGVTKPRVETMDKMAKALDVPYDEIMQMFYGKHNL